MENRSREEFDSTWNDRNYEEGTRDFYKSPRIADEYHRAFAARRDLRALRFRIIAGRERAIVERWLVDRRPREVIDIPCGTGKLARSFERVDAGVCACDVSADMRDIARRSFAEAGCRVRFIQCNAESVSDEVRERFDAFVCLRLLHRVPAAVRDKILTELSKMAPWGILSMGLESPYHVLRRGARRMMVGGGRGYAYESLRSFRRAVARDFHVLSIRRVLPILSQEALFLVQSRRFKRGLA